MIGTKQTVSSISGPSYCKWAHPGGPPGGGCLLNVTKIPQGSIDTVSPEMSVGCISRPQRLPGLPACPHSLSKCALSECLHRRRIHSCESTPVSPRERHTLGVHLWWRRVQSPLKSRFWASVWVVSHPCPYSSIGGRYGRFLLPWI